MKVLQRHRWPGNVRELRNAVEGAATLASPEAEISPSHLLQMIQLDLGDAHEFEEGPTLKEILLRAERGAIEEAIRIAGGNRERAAQLLGISPATLYRRRSTGIREAPTTRKSERPEGAPTLVIERQESTMKTIIKAANS
jgi:transcriptional regulator with PAS, ATPase and Fis domain